MDAFSDPNVERIVCMTASQVGKTEILNNICGYYVHHDACPILVLQPTLEMARAWSVDRLAPMIASCKPLKDQIGEAKTKDGDNTILLKTFRNGARLSIAGSNSPASLASRPIRIVLMDEIDRFPPSAGTEGDPVALATRRTQNFFNRKIALFSTPTIAGESRIEAAYAESDQRKYEVPCKCGEYQALKWGNVKWDENEPETARYECRKCKESWTDLERKQRIRSGRWTASAPFKSTAGFHLNALSSPWTTLGGLAREFLEAKHHGPESLRVFVNTALAECWTESSEEIDEHDLKSRVEKYDSEIPDTNVVCLTAGIDIQSDRLEILTCGHGHLDELWMLDCRIIYGNPATDYVWTEAAAYLKRPFKHPSGKELRIVRTFVDSGYETQRVYRFVAQMAGHGVWASKGVGGTDRPPVGRPSKNNSARCNVFPIGTNHIKTVIFSRMRNSEPGPGYYHIGQWADDEFIRQLTSEKAVKRYVKGIPHLEFKKVRERNEALDLLVLNIAAFSTLNADTKRIQKNLSEVRKPEAQPKPRIQKSWVSGVRRNNGKFI